MTRIWKEDREQYSLILAGMEDISRVERTFRRDKGKTKGKNK